LGRHHVSSLVPIAAVTGQAETLRSSQAAKGADLFQTRPPKSTASPPSQDSQQPVRNVEQKYQSLDKKTR
jgi:hypothetical protein